RLLGCGRRTADRGPYGRPADPVPLPGAVLLRGGLAAGAGLLLFVGVVRPFLAGLGCREAELLLAREPGRAVPLPQGVVALDAGRDLYWAKLGDAAQRAALGADDPARRSRLLDLARTALGRAADLVPCSAFHRFNLGQCLYCLAFAGQAAPDEVCRAFD